jgi:putative rfbX protein
MISKLKRIILNNMIQIKNFGYLSALQLFTLFIPIIIYPYLIRVIGKEIWGEIVFAQVIISYASLFINFGFDVSATRDVSVNRDNPIELSKIVSSVFITKLFFGLISTLSVILLINFIPFFSYHKLLYLYTFIFCLGDIFFPIYFFLGIEKMKYITFINLFTKLLFLLFVFIFVKDKSDYILVPLFNGLGAAIGGIIAMVIAIKIYNIKILLVSIAILKSRINTSVNYFITDLSIVLKDRVNLLVIGTFIGFTEVAYYDLGTKIVHIAQTPFSIINRVLLPSFAKEFSRRKLILSVWIFTTVSFLIALLLIIFSDVIVIILGGGQMLPASNIIYIYAIVIPLACISSIYGIGLASQGVSKNYMLSDLYSFIVYLIAVLSLYVFYNVSIYTLPIPIILSVIFTIFYKQIYLKKNKLL